MPVPKFWVEKTDDESVEFFVGETPVASFDHDQHGWSGIREAERMFEKVAKAVGAKFESK
jgi:hypothetical protein